MYTQSQHTTTGSRRDPNLHLVTRIASHPHLVPLNASREIDGLLGVALIQQGLRCGKCHFMLQPSGKLCFKAQEEKKSQQAFCAHTVVLRGKSELRVRREYVWLLGKPYMLIRPG